MRDLQNELSSNEYDLREAVIKDLKENFKFVELSPIRESSGGKRYVNLKISIGNEVKNVQIYHPDDIEKKGKKSNDGSIDLSKLNK